VEQVVAEAAVVVAPDPHVQPGGGDTAGPDAHGTHDVACNRVLDRDLVGLELSPQTCHRDVTAAIDHHPGIGVQPSRHRVGTKALPGPPGIDHHPGRTRDYSRLVIDDDLTPS